MKMFLTNVNGQCPNRGTAGSHDAAQSWADHVCMDGLLHAIPPLPTVPPAGVSNFSVVSNSSTVFRCLRGTGQGPCHMKTWIRLSRDEAHGLRNSHGCKNVCGLSSVPLQGEDSSGSGRQIGAIAGFFSILGGPLASGLILKIGR